MSKPLFVLICDRSQGYFQMTIQAIRCLRKHTKTVPIGVIFPAGSGVLADNQKAVLSALAAIDKGLKLENIFFKEGINHFENWNPTQHKLDLELWANEFDPIIWLDSDTVVLKDLVPFINGFVSTGKKFAFLADHVNNDPNFKKNWEGPLFVPQACYMIFRSPYIPEFFKIWEETWKEWISPYPFQRHKDPAPHFNNSFFCIEQYALGQSIFKYVKETDFDKEIHRIDRSQLFIGRNVAVDTQKIKEEFQGKSASRPSALAHVPHVEPKDFKTGKKTEILLEQPKSPQSVPRSPQTVPVNVVSPQAGAPADSFSFPSNPEVPAATTTTTAVTTTTYAPEATEDEGGFIVTATYTTAPGAFLSDGSVTSSSSSSFPGGVGESQGQVGGPSPFTTSYQPSSYVSSYLIPSSYPTSYSRVTSYTTSYTGVTSYTAGATTSYGASASAATSYSASASAATSYAASASAATSYGASGATSYGASGATSYASSYASSYPTSGSYGYVSSLSSSAGLSTLYTEDGGLPLTNYGNLTLQFSLPGEGGSTDTASSSMYVYGALDSNVYFLTTNAALASSSQATNLSNSNNEFFMVDLIQDNSIAHYYNANQGVNSNFVADHGTVVANTISQVKKNVVVPALVKVYTPPPQNAPEPKKTGKK